MLCFLRRVGAFAIVLAGAASPASATVTMDALLDELVDLERLARFPTPPYTNQQASSYDRASVSPAADGWFANDDRGHFVRVETREDGSNEYVMMDAPGPGAIVRIWSANPADAGIVRVYLDHAETPAIEMPFTEMLGGEVAPFVDPIAGVRGRGWNAFLPIPYATHCKVTASEPSFFYHINYRTYPDDIPMETFSLEEAAARSGKINALAARLAAPATAPPPMPDPPFLEQPLDLALPGWSQGEIGIDLAGGAVHRLEVMVEAEDIEAALRGTVLEIRFDDQTEPAVRAPIGDFFGTAPGLNPYRSIVSGVREDGLLYSNWVMPFRERLVLKLVNHADGPVAVSGRIVVQSFTWCEDSLYFHAKWHEARDIPTVPPSDFRFVGIEGRGRYVGNMLHIGNPVPQWWGEGDEKIYVDGEEFPSTFGTGTEDYYGYAWCDTALFTHAFHNQVRCDGPDNYGNTCVSRFHVIDDIPFQQSFVFDMEILHWIETSVNYAVTNYWYAAPGATDDTPPINTEALEVPVIPPMPEPMRVEGALEAEDFVVTEVTGGQHLRQLHASWGWSGDAQLWWIDAAPGDRLRVGFPVAEAGRYRVYARFTKAPDYGIVQIALNGEEAGGPIDLYHPTVISAEESLLGVFTLAAGQQDLSFVILGAHPEAELRHMVGLDYLRLEPDPGENAFEATESAGDGHDEDGSAHDDA